MSGSRPASPTSSGDSSGYPSLGDFDDGLGLDGSREENGDGLSRGRNPPGKFLPAIFVHAGAGFHSHHNERIHLEACNESASIGIKFLRAGASATEAVEAALKSLEDKEVTNAGYGSNLSIDGTVECDATIVDHLGRSGACGAVPNIRNPISLAKLILDSSNVPLTLRRVPPNILVGHGARNFAKEHGMQIHSNDSLISKNAHDRFRRWQKELHRTDVKLLAAIRPGIPPPEKKSGDHLSSRPVAPLAVAPVVPAPPIETMDHEGSSRQRDHINAISTATWNEGQPDSPSGGSPAPSESGGIAQSSLTRNSRSNLRLVDRGPLSARDPLKPAAGREPSPKRAKQSKGGSISLWPVGKASEDVRHGKTHGNNGDGPGSCRTSVEDAYSTALPSDVLTSLLITACDEGSGEPLDPIMTKGTKRPFEQDVATDSGDDEDTINDTIGAIAVDEDGHMAAASSSGGIGMKHRGRVGPAALVGIGTVVIPGVGASPDVSVAAVTSGTGEHMATTMASRRCAERIFGSTRMGAGGFDIAEPDDDRIMKSFIQDDFMGHPGVTSCHSAGAIGVMVVKTTPAGICFYFAHNTDSFALASMGGVDEKPLCVMSRLKDGKEAQGGRKVSTS